MRRRANRAAGALGTGMALGLVLGIELAARAEGAQPFHVDYRAPSSCPDESALVSRIRARVDVRPALPGEPVPTFGITLRNEGERVVGRIASTSERSEPTSREVSGTDCSDVVDAVALIVTMAIAPGAANTPAPNALSIEAPAPSEKPAPIVKAADGPRFKLLGSAQAEATLAYVPTTLLAAGARLQLFRTSSYVGGPSVAIGFVAVQSVERQMDVGRASLGFDVGELFVCPVSIALGASVSARPCGRFDVGRVQATGADIPNAKSKTLTWVSLGALGQVTFVPVKPLVIDAQASLLVPVTPYEFVFAPGSVIYGAQRIGFSTSIALGVMFL